MKYQKDEFGRQIGAKKHNQNGIVRFQRKTE